MKDENIEALMAGQTAMLSTIVNLLVDNGSLNNKSLTEALRSLIDEAEAGGYTASMGPIQHLLSLLRPLRDETMN